MVVANYAKVFATMSNHEPLMNQTTDKMKAPATSNLHLHLQRENGHNWQNDLQVSSENNNWFNCFEIYLERARTLAIG